MRTTLDVLRAAGDARQVLFKQYTTDVKAVDGTETQFRFTISTATPDRERDVISPDGWQLSNYLKNPVVLFGHDYRSLPVATARTIERTQHGLASVADFTETAKVYPFAATVCGMVRCGALRATSVGFAPVKYVFNEERRGVDFTEQELLEYSIVPVPANAECLVEARAAGVDLEPLREWAARTQEYLRAAGVAPAGPALPELAAIALTIEGKTYSLAPGGAAAKGVLPKSYNGYETVGHTATSKGTTAPDHVHDYYLWVYVDSRGVERFDGGRAADVADHGHRITAESLAAGRTEESDGHVHELMRAGVKAAKDGMPTTTPAGTTPCTGQYGCQATEHADGCPMRGPGPSDGPKALAAKLDALAGSVDALIARLALTPVPTAPTPVVVTAGGTNAEDVLTLDAEEIDLDAIVVDADVELTADEVRAAFREAVTADANAAVAQAIRRARGRID